MLHQPVSLLEFAPNRRKIVRLDRITKDREPCSQRVPPDILTWAGMISDGWTTSPLPGGSSPGNIRNFVELIVPELQARGLFRADYEAATLRPNLVLPLI